VRVSSSAATLKGYPIIFVDGEVDAMEDMREVYDDEVPLSQA